MDLELHDLLVYLVKGLWIISNQLCSTVRQDQR